LDFKLISSDNKITINFGNLASYWYRRGSINLKYNKNLNVPTDVSNDNFFLYVLDKYLVEENEIVINFLYELIYNLPGFGKLKENKTNKLTNLMIANLMGMKTPNSMVSNQKVLLIDFFNKYDKKIITKSLTQGGGLFWDNQMITSLTKVVSIDELANMNGKWVSYIQNMVNKRYELRIFYLDQKIFASAIFSQGNENTLVDFRNYDDEKPNRVVPYILPKNIEDSLIKFMQKISMKSGSIDMIVDEFNNYIFLEVNPIGQFSQVSIPCNNFIEEYIANYLLNEKN
jgi:ATP-GRASP peptide maturase of grasp-with-spasm system